ncbi:hypothetical protein DMUE_3891 [Dictyocoela muelleri]|nr:hypothetical protein DMUE_3891 [Dictyocoela muelleri]
MNKNQIKYLVNDYVFIKNHDSDKITLQWIGPFRICDVSKCGNNVFVNKNNKVVRVSIKSCRLFKERGGCSEHHAKRYTINLRFYIILMIMSSPVASGYLQIKSI